MFASKVAASVSLLLAAASASPLLPRRSSAGGRVVQYVQNFSNETSGQPFSIDTLVGTGVTHVLLAALHINNGDPTGITLNSDNPNSSYYDATWAQAAQLQQNGIKVMFMMGGAAAGSYSTLCDSDGDIDFTYYDPLLQTLQFHHIDGIDLDIEQSNPQACAENLIDRLKHDMGCGFIVTMAPVASDMTSANYGLSGFSYKSLDATAAGQTVDWYNVQYYSGFVQGSIEQSYEAAVQNGFSPSRLVLGALDNADDGSGWVSLSNLQSTISNLRSRYPDFGDVDAWEYFNAGASDGLSQPNQWTAAIAGSVRNGSVSHTESKKKKHHRHHHHSPLPDAVQTLMQDGHDQLPAAKAVRLAQGHLEKAREILESGN